MNYICTNCKFETPKKAMTCPNCKEFWTMEVWIQDNWNKKSQNYQKVNLPIKYDYKKRVDESLKRYAFNSESLNEFFWSSWKNQKWLVKGSINFLSAEPWTWKSTFLWQILNFLEDKSLKVLYYSWEENTFQIWDRLNKLYSKNLNLLNNINVYYWENLEEFLGLVERDQPDLVVLDSIQTIYSNEKDTPKMSLSQQEFCIEKIRSIFKEKEMTAFVIWHVNKDWDLAWKKTLEHMVDWIFFLEWQEGRTDSIRIMKSLKNRYWWNDNIVVMKMNENWFKIVEASEAFKIFIEESWNWPWWAFTWILEWNQLFLLEIQSLLTSTSFSYPARVWEWISKQKLDILIATLINQTKFALNTKDIFINIISPFKFKNINIDLATISSIISSFLEKDIKKYIFIWQVDLQWVIRTVPKQEELVKKLLKMGYKSENIITREKYNNINDLIKKLFIN